MVHYSYHTIQHYSACFTTAESPILAAINCETHAAVPLPQMLSGHFQGRVLAMFSQMIQPTRILEIGTYTGYATLCLAEGLQKKGVLHTIDKNAALAERVKSYLDQAGIAHQVQYHIGQALAILPHLHDVFDLVFIDADKKNYIRYYNSVLDKVRPGGFIMVDNVLWGGSVLEKHKDKRTQAIIDFTTYVHQDERVENSLFPIRDGLLVVRKK